jgi:alanyl-tRNA synthetase
MTAQDIINIYVSFFEKREHKQIPNAPLIPENDPTTLFTSSGMQPLIPYFLGETHPSGQRLVNVQNCFRAVDIEEVGDNRHTTFFRMLGNWSLGGYFKKEEIPWFWELLTKGFELPKERLHVTVFNGTDDGLVEKDNEAYRIWKEVLDESFGSPQDSRIFWGGDSSNWWSRSGIPKNMPVGEIGGPDTEVFYEFEQIEHDLRFGDLCHPNCQCGRFMEIGNAVFMQYKKTQSGFEALPQKNVDYGGGIERLLAAYENTHDVFKTSLFSPIIKAVEDSTGKTYEGNEKLMRIIADHLIAAVFMVSAGIKPSKAEHGYVLRRLLRRGFDNFEKLGGKDLTSVVHKIVEQYKETDPVLVEKFEEIKLTILEEEQGYKKTIEEAIKMIGKTDSNEITKEITADEAFKLYSTHGLSPTQIRSLGYIFDEQEFANKMEEHQKLSREGAGQRFKGGLADVSEKTVAGHTATHLLHRALKDILGEEVNQAGSNITDERVRFDFTYNQKLTDEEIQKVEDIVNDKIRDNLEITCDIMPLEKAKEQGAMGLFEEKYQDEVKVYSIGEIHSSDDSGFSIDSGKPYSIEICGGPHVDFTGKLKRFKIIKQDNIGHGLRRIYAKVG